MGKWRSFGCNHSIGSCCYAYDMASIKGRINSVDSFVEFARKLKDFWWEHKYINVSANDKRSLDQNATIRLCYKQIQDSWEGMTAKDVERHCKLTYGVPILRANSIVFNDVIGRLERIYDYEQMLKIMDTFQITSHDEFSTESAKEFIQMLMTDFPHIRIEKP